MKQCSTCRTTYTDDSLRFCLADGGTLVSIPDEEATLVSPKNDPFRVDIETSARRTEPVTQESSKPSTTKIVLVIGLFGVLIVGAAIVAAALIYVNKDKRAENVLPTPTVANASPTPDAEKQKLQDQLANIQRQLDEKKSADKNTPATPATPKTDTTGFVTARVNSPGDGFLALRDKPHAGFGNRLAKIPHGATVTIENCGPLQQRLGGRIGRWCMVTWNNQTGYVFDAFLDRQ
jgi:hypothetical protein